MLHPNYTKISDPYLLLGNNYLIESWGGNCISPIIKVYVHVHVHIHNEYIKNFSTLILVNKLDYKVKIHTIQYELYMFKQNQFWMNFETAPILFKDI